MYELDREALDSFVGSPGYRLERRKNAYLLPLPTRATDRTKFEKGYNPIVAGILRKLRGVQFDDIEESDLVEQAIDKGDFEDDLTKRIFKGFLLEQLEELQTGNILSLKQLEQVPLSENKNEQKGELDIIDFFYDTYISGEEESILKILSRVEQPSLITEVLDSIILQKTKEKNTKINYGNHLPILRAQFISDLDTLSKNTSFFLSNIEHLFTHYTLIMMSQLILKIPKYKDFNPHVLEPLYFFVHWEKAARWRSGYKQGYSLLSHGLETFYTHEHVLNLLGYNTFTTGNNYFYHDYVKLLSEIAGSEEQFAHSIYRWLEEVFSERANVDVSSLTRSSKINDAFIDLNLAIEKRVSSEIKSRYRISFESFVNRFYRKNGGSLGNLLSLTQEQILTLVAVIVKKDKIELKRLWKALELRGVWLDNRSKKEVIEMLDKLNYMEKKSDSGDAQYVKSIL